MISKAKFKPTGHRRPVHRPREYEQADVDTEKFYTRELQFTNEDLDEVPDLSEYPNLIGLYLSVNNITDVRGCFDHLVNLKDLGLGHNQLTDIKGCFDKLVSLEALSLETNQLSYVVGCFDGLDKLKYVWLAGNPLSDESINYLKQLKYRGINAQW
jgi:Leucine-rich repeat (LRR) protein